VSLKRVRKSEAEEEEEEEEKELSVPKAKIVHKTDLVSIRIQAIITLIIIITNMATIITQCHNHSPISSYKTTIIIKKPI
jgi:hypothetical protein